MWKQLRIPIGVSDFRKIRENGYYYMDKSGLIEELLKTDATYVRRCKTVEERSAEKLWGRCPGISVRLWKSRGTGKKAFRPG